MEGSPADDDDGVAPAVELESAGLLCTRTGDEVLDIAR